MPCCRKRRLKPAGESLRLLSLSLDLLVLLIQVFRLRLSESHFELDRVLTYRAEMQLLLDLLRLGGGRVDNGKPPIRPIRVGAEDLRLGEAVLLVGQLNVSFQGALDDHARRGLLLDQLQLETGHRAPLTVELLAKSQFFNVRGSLLEGRCAY